MRRQSETLKMLEVIDAGMYREYADGSFCKASFEMSDGTYTVTNDFVVKKIDNVGNVQELPVHFCKGGIYPEVNISGMPIKLYVLTMLAVDSSAFEKYQSGLEINHTIISKTQPKLLNIGNLYNNGVVTDTAPLKKLSANPSYLEFCTRSENVKHGKFIKDFSLYDTYVSAHDVDELRQLLVPYDSCMDEVKDDWVALNRFNVEKFYHNKGVEQQVLF